MAKKIKQEVKQSSQKSLRKTLLDQIEGKLNETLKDFPRKISEKKFRKTIHKAGKLLTHSIALKPVKVVSQSDIKKSKKKKPEIKEVKTEAAS